MNWRNASFVLICAPAMLLIAMVQFNWAATNLPEGWKAAKVVRNDYEIAVDREVAHSGKASACIKSKRSTPDEFGSFFQTIRADRFSGKRVRFSAYVRTQEAQPGAALWMRLDTQDGTTVGFDNMADRIIGGTTDWKEYQIVLDVPKAAQSIFFGLLLSGEGKAWIDDAQIQTVTKDVPVTRDWSQLPYGWKFRSAALKAYKARLDRTVAHGGKGSGFLGSEPAEKAVSGTLAHTLRMTEVKGDKVYLSGYVKTKNADTGAGLWISIVDRNGKEVSQTDMKQNPIRGTTDWKKYELSVALPKDSAFLDFGFTLQGKGKAWIDDAQLEVTEKDKPPANRRSIAKFDFEKTVAEAEKQGAHGPDGQKKGSIGDEPKNLDFESP